MSKLGDLAKLIRSKNAGPFHITFDIIIRDPDVYQQMKERCIITEKTFEEIYGVTGDDVVFINYDEANAFKATIPRLYTSGSVKDGDIMGGQQHGPLVDLEVNLGSKR